MNTNEGLGMFAVGAAAAILAKSSPGAALAMLVTAATYDDVVRRSEASRKKLRVVANNAAEKHANSKMVNNLLQKHGYKLDSMRYLKGDGMEWELSVKA